VNSIVACCHGAKLCAYAARDFLSQQYQESFVKTIFPSSGSTIAGTSPTAATAPGLKIASLSSFLTRVS